MKLISRNGRTETPTDGKDYLTTEGQFSSDHSKHYVSGDGRAAVIADEEPEEPVDPTPDDPDDSGYPENWDVENFSNQELLSQIYNGNPTDGDDPNVVTQIQTSGVQFYVSTIIASGERILSVYDGVQAVMIDPSKQYIIFNWSTLGSTAAYDLNQAIAVTANLNKVQEITSVATDPDDNSTLRFTLGNIVIQGHSETAKVNPLVDYTYNALGWFQLKSSNGTITTSKRSSPTQVVYRQTGEM